MNNFIKKTISVSLAVWLAAFFVFINLPLSHNLQIDFNFSDVDSYVQLEDSENKVEKHASEVFDTHHIIKLEHKVCWACLLLNSSSQNPPVNYSLKTNDTFLYTLLQKNILLKSSQFLFSGLSRAPPSNIS